MSDKFEANREAMSEAIKKAKDKGEDGFLSWFNRATSAKEGFVRGAWDFIFYFVSPDVVKLIAKPEEKVCLEIGYGGGRLLNASRLCFKHSHGVDVHPYAENIRDLLLKEKPENDFTLHTLDKAVLPIEDGSIDYAYSYIVIQHFYEVNIFTQYMSEMRRVVKPGGIANLFFADISYYNRPLGVMSRARAFIRGYIQDSAPPDDMTAHNTLWMHRRYVAGVLKEYGFDVISYRRSFRNVPDGCPQQKGTQTGVLAVRR